MNKKWCLFLLILFVGSFYLQIKDRDFDHIPRITENMRFIPNPCFLDYSLISSFTEGNHEYEYAKQICKEKMKEKKKEAYIEALIVSFVFILLVFGIIKLFSKVISLIKRKSKSND